MATSADPWAQVGDPIEAAPPGPKPSPEPAVAGASDAAPLHEAHDPWAQLGVPADGPAPITDSGLTRGFADEAPREPTRQLSTDDTATFYKMLRGEGVPQASAKELRDFVATKGLALSNADEIVRQRDAGLGVVGQIILQRVMEAA